VSTIEPSRNLPFLETLAGQPEGNVTAQTGLDQVVEECLGSYTAAVLERSAQPFLLVDLRGHVVRVNQAFCDVVGYSPEELRRLNVLDITPERWHARTHERVRHLLETDRPLRYEKEYRTKDGRIVPVDLVADIFRDGRGCPVGFFSFITDLTRVKEAERAARDSEARFRDLFDLAPVGYHEIDSEGRIVSINRTEADLLGYSPEELVGRPIADFVAPDHREQARRAVLEKLAGHRPLHPFERPLIRRDGTIFHAAIQERARLDDSGQILGLRTTVQDVTERKEMEEALIASERRARALFEGIEDAVFVHDLTGRILDANPAASRLFGYSHQELLELSTRDIDAEDFATNFPERLARQLRQGHLSLEGRHRARDGRVFPVEINSSVISFEGETAILAVVRDVAERKALEETRRQFAEAQMRHADQLGAKNRALVESESRYRQLAEATLDAIVVADGLGNITLFNPAAERIFALSSQDVIGQPLTSLVSETQAEFSLADLRLDLHRADPQFVGKTVELQGRRATGEIFPIEMALAAVGREDRLDFIASIRDLTERQRMRAMLVQSEKLASLGILSAGVAHEINNPLAYVANNLAILQRDLKAVLGLVELYESARESISSHDPRLLERIEAAAQEFDWAYARENLPRLIQRTRGGVDRVATIVDSMRGLARTAPAEKQDVLLTDLIAGVREIVGGNARRAGVRIEVEAPDQLTKLRCVPNQISQVILNLVLNALQAIESVADRPDRRISLVVQDGPQAQTIDVIDNGCGIPAENLARLFDPFFTTKPVGEGTGLGLSIAHGIVTAHGGQLQVESTPGVGSSFRIVLPKT
jgi:PAS domain S-box-containing protein